MKKIIAKRLAVTLLLFVAASVQSAPFQIRPTSEKVTIIVHHIEHAIGQEQYQLDKSSDDIILTSKLSLINRGGSIELTSSLRLGSDFTPKNFQAKGQTYRFVNVDVQVDIRRGSAEMRSLAEASTMKVPAHFFTARGYSPLAARALLVQYWERHGRPREITLLPDRNKVTVDFRGIDSVQVQGRTMQLRRYSVEGVVWGRETLWLDDRGLFAAILTRIHILPLEGVREDLIEALPLLQRLAVQDRMADLATLSRQVPPLARGTFALVGARVIDGTIQGSLDDATVLISDGRITAVGPRMKLYNRLSPDAVVAITSRAHEVGMTVTGHIPTMLSLKEAVESGMDQFEHLPIRGEPDSTEVRDTVRFLADHGTVASLTLAWDELLGRAPDTPVSSFEPGILPSATPLVSSYNSVKNNIDSERARANRGRGLAIVKALHAAGVPIVAGTDGAVPAGYSLLRMLELFVEAGMTPAEALATATTVPAKVMGMTNEVGTIEKGKRADLLILDVALKLLPEEFASDHDRLARFQREAQLLASLNHPHIAAIYGLEEMTPGGLVMELVDGPTLSERITQGPLPIEEALVIARQIAEALEYAQSRA